MPESGESVFKSDVVPQARENGTHKLAVILGIQYTFEMAQLLLIYKPKSHLLDDVFHFKDLNLVDSVISN